MSTTDTEQRRKRGRPSRGLVAKNFSLFDHQHNALLRVAKKQGRTFPEVLRSALDALDLSMSHVKFSASMQSKIRVSRNHITITQHEKLTSIAKETGATMAHLTRVAVMLWLDNQPK